METDTLRPVATICHNDHAVADGVRVTLYTKNGDENLWAAAADEEPYRTDVAVENMAGAWSGPQWDLQVIED